MGFTIWLYQLEIAENRRNMPNGIRIKQVVAAFREKGMKKLGTQGSSYFLKIILGPYLCNFPMCLYYYSINW